eukprot:2544493-Rhodomonas_salina.1
MTWRPDETLIDFRSKSLATLEFTRPWDRDPLFDQRHDVLKTDRYCPWLQHLERHLGPLGWSVRQCNLTVGARGSLPTDRWREHLSFLSLPPRCHDPLLQDLHDAALNQLVE